MANEKDKLRDYIAFRYPNWHDYAKHIAIVNHFEGWENDLLNDIILDLLHKPIDKINEMLSAETSKTVNGRPTTELDKFVLRMMELNGSSPVAPFRKNTLGFKIISRTGGSIVTQHPVRLNGFDKATDDYSAERDSMVEQFHAANIERLTKNLFAPRAIAIYNDYIIHNRPQCEMANGDSKTLATIMQFLTTKQKTLSDD